MMLNKVDLPQPEGPITPRNSPGATESETPSTATTTPSGVSNRLVILSTTRMPSGTAAGLDTADSTGDAMLVPRGAPTLGLAGPYSTSQVLSAPRSPDQTPLPRRYASNELRLIGPAGPPAPVLPGPIERIGAGARDHLVDLAGGEELDVAQRHRLHLQLGVHFEIDRDEHGVADVGRRNCRAMAAHQNARTGPDRTRQVAPHLDVLNQERGVAKLIMRVPGRHVVADVGTHMEKRPELALSNAERDHARAVIVHDRMHIRPRFVDAAMDEALQIGRPLARIDGIALERELHDVVLLDALGRTCAREQEALRVVGMARAHVPERVHDAFVRQDAVGGDDLFEQHVEVGHKGVSFGFLACVTSFVMAGLVPAIHVLITLLVKTWMPATSAGMTEDILSTK